MERIKQRNSTTYMYIYVFSSESGLFELVDIVENFVIKLYTLSL